MIESFSVKGFKGLDGLELPKLSRIVLLGGKNNVGKTSVLEALHILLNRRPDPNMLLRQYHWRGIPSVPLTPESQFAPIFSGYDLGGGISLRASVDGRSTRAELSYNPRYGASSVPTRNRDDSVSPPVVRTDEGVQWRSSLDIVYATGGDSHQQGHVVLEREGVGYVADDIVTPDASLGFYPSAYAPNPAETAVLYGALDKEGRTETILKALQVIDPRIKGLTSIADAAGSMIHADIGLPRKLPVSFMGEGTAKLLALSVYVATARNSVMLVDEIENGFHHSVMRDVWRVLAAAVRLSHCQVIATTHSQECIAAAHEAIGGDEEQDLTYIRLAREGEQVKAYTLDPEALSAAMDGWIEVR